MYHGVLLTGTRLSIDGKAVTFVDHVQPVLAMQTSHQKMKEAFALGKLLVDTLYCPG